MLKTFSIGGIHPSDKKISKDCKIEVLPVPSKVFISVAQHLGAPATPIVKAGDQVKVGQVIAEPAGFISAYVHSSVSGTVKSVGPRKDLAGNNMTHIEIDVEGDEWIEGVDLTDTLVTAIPEDNKAILEKIKMCGVVGLGGAAFPTWAKLNEMRNEEYTVDTVLVNAAECEPYITSDNRMMVDHPELIVKCVEYMRQYMNEYLKDARFVICIEKNKPDAIAKMKEVFAGKDYVEIQELKAIYPQGAKQVMLYNATGRVSIAGKRFPYFHAIIINVSSLAKVAEYLSTGMPLVERIVTVDGPVVK